MPKIKNQRLEEIFNEIIEPSENAMAAIRSLGSFRYYIDHDNHHLHKVSQNVQALVSGRKFYLDLNDKDAGKSELNDIEKFILKVSCYVHDLGMLCTDGKQISLNDIEATQKIRKIHSKNIKKILDDTPINIIVYTEYGEKKYHGDLRTIKSIFSDRNKISREVRKWIIRICENHSQQPIVTLFNDNKIKPYFEFRDEQFFTDKYIRPALLIALLRLADGLVYSHEDTTNYLGDSRKSKEIKTIEDKWIREWKDNNSVIDSNKDEFYQKQIIEYWKHEVTEKVIIDNDISTKPIKIKLIFFPDNYPKIKNENGEFSITEIAIDDIKREFLDPEKGANGIFTEYGLEVDLYVNNEIINPIIYINGELSNLLKDKNEILYNGFLNIKQEALKNINVKYIGYNNHCDRLESILIEYFKDDIENL